MTVIDIVERVRVMRYDLNDESFIVSRNFRIEGIKIERMLGTVNNMPQQLRRIHTDNALGRFGSPDMISELKQVLAKERMIGECQIPVLDPHFYINPRESMKELGRDDFDRIKSMMLGPVRMRRGKLMRQTDSIKVNLDLYGRSAVDENVLYKTICENSTSFEKQLMGGSHE